MRKASLSSAHIAENIDIFDFELTDVEMESINSLDKGEPFYVPPMKHLLDSQLGARMLMDRNNLSKKALPEL